MFLTALLASLTIVAPQQPAPAAPPPEATQAQARVSAALDAAEATFWAALEDAGAPALLRLGRARLAAAAALPGAGAPAFQARIRQLRQDFAAQEEMVHDTLRANFPAYRLLRDGLVHEVLVDEPWVVATTRSAEGVAGLIQTGWPRQAQYDVVGTAHMQHAGDEPSSAPVARWDMVNEAYYVLGQHPRVWLDPRKDRAPQAAGASSRLRLDVDFTDRGTVPPLWWVTGAGIVREAEQPVGQSLRAFGFALDLRDRLWPLVVLLVLGAVVGCRRAPRVTREKAAAAGALLVGGLAVVLALVLFRDRLPAADGLTVTGLWAVLAIAALASLGPLLLVVALPGRFPEALGGLSSLWADEDVGRWPAQVGGSLPILGAVLIECGPAPAAMATLGWWAALDATRRLDGIRTAAWQRGSLAAAMLVAVAFVAAGCVFDDSAIAVIAWSLVGVAAAAAIWRSHDVMVGALTPCVALAAVSALPVLALGIGGLAWGLALSRRSSGWRSGAGASSSGTGVGASRKLPFREHLEELSRRHAACFRDRLSEGDLARLRNAEDRWVRVDVQVGRASFWRSVAYAFAEAEGACVVDLDPGVGASDPLLALREFVGSTRVGLQDRLARSAQTISAGAVDPVGESRALSRALAKKLREGDRDYALLLPDAPPRELEEVMDAAETHYCTSDRAGDGRVWVLSLQAARDDSASKDRSMPLEADFTGAPIRDFLQREVGLAPDAEGRCANALDKLAPLACVDALRRVVDRGLLRGSAPLPLSVPEREVSDVVDALVAEAAGSIPTLSLPEHLERDVCWLLEVAAHVGRRFDLAILCEALEMDLPRTSRALCDAGGVVADADGDGEFEFCHDDQFASLQRAGAAAPGGRLKQSMLYALGSCIRSYGRRVSEGAPRATDNLIHGLALTAEALEGGGSRRALAEDAAPLIAALGHQRAALMSRGSVVEPSLERLLDLGDWCEVARNELLTTLLRLQSRGPVSNQGRPSDRAIAALLELEQPPGSSPSAVGDELRLQIARRCVDNMRKEVSAAAWTAALEVDGSAASVQPLGAVRAMLCRLAAAEDKHPLIAARSRFELATLDYLASQKRGGGDPLDACADAVRSLEGSVAALREVGDEQFILPALIQLVQAQTSLYSLRDACAGEDAGGLDEKIEEGIREARELARQRDPALLRPLLTPKGFRHWEHWRKAATSGGRDARRHLERARGCFVQNLDDSEQAGDRNGMRLMPSLLAPVSYRLDDRQGQRKYCEMYAINLTRFDGDGQRDQDPYLIVHRYVLDLVEGRQRKSSDPALAEAWGHRDLVEMRELLRFTYAPHLDHLEA